MQMIAILAKPPNFTATNQHIMSAMKETMAEIERDFAKTTRTWKRKPTFDKRMEARPEKVEVEVSTASDIYRYVSGGTRVRYATMTPDFTTKTVPQWIGARPGRGGLLYINKKRPRPGIKKRGFDKAIAKKQAPYFFRRMTVAMSEIAKSSGHAI